MSAMSSLRRQLDDYWPHKYGRIAAGKQRAKIERKRRVSALLEQQRVSHSVPKPKGFIARLRERFQRKGATRRG